MIECDLMDSIRVQFRSRYAPVIIPPIDEQYVYIARHKRDLNHSGKVRLINFIITLGAGSCLHQVGGNVQFDLTDFTDIQILAIYKFCKYVDRETVI